MEYFRQRFIDELNDEGPVTVRTFEWPSVDVLSTMAPELYEAHFVDWLAGQKQNAKDRAREFLTQNGCLDRFNHLSAQCHNQRVLPFVGAGLSRSSGFPMWGDFLATLTADYPACRPDLESHLAAWRYEEAAQLMLDRMGKDIFDEAVQSTFGHKAKAINGPIQLLPLVFDRGAMTTNFDYILDRVYDQSGKRFDAVFSGQYLREAPRRIGDNPHCLLRLHGEADSGIGRVLAQTEYEANYGVEGSYREVLRAILNASSLLFMGCSLNVDRTLTALIELKRAAVVASPRHYAFLPLTVGLDREARRAELGRADIHPIWYPPEDHDQAIEDLLISLMEGGLHD
ncbi:MAG: hypothetical protein CFE33_20135 [Pseudorhodobacter sp. PARRP1]|nr:MAG: hypothetical protein CFE33_20135 [Pseudorhodobacter sp. PARRP1]